MTFPDGPARFPFATDLDTGAVYGSVLSALTIGVDSGWRFSSVQP